MRSQIYARFLAFVTILAFGVGLLAGPLSAQYFGRNKVQYEKFDFKVMKTKHFDIYFYPKFVGATEQAARMAERWYARLSRIFNHELKGRQPLILYASSTDFQQTTAIPELLGEGTGGVTEPFKRRIVLPIGISLADTDHVVGHELVHAFQFDITSAGNIQGGGANSGAMRLPLWFIEGMAEYLSIGPVDPNTAMWMRDAVRRKDLPKIKKLENSKYFPYRWGQALWSYITGRWGDEILPRLMKTAGRVGEYEKIMEKVLGTSMDNLSKDWHESMKKAYDPVMAKTQVVDPASRVLFKGAEENPYNISPAVSPDGQQIISLSTRDMYSIDMYLADTKTGKIKLRITRTATNPEFESIQFIKSAGSWEPSGKKFVFGAVSKGKAILSIYDVSTEKVEKEISFSELGEILNPTWSPDGRDIAFSALANGVTDLFVYDLEKSELRQLTNDSFADLHPAWSPDGRAIAFVTDRFSTDLSILNMGEYEVALIDPASGKIQKVQGFPNAKNINPQWSPDSKSLYFLSDPNGKTDIYRIDLDTGKIFEVTNLYTGVSGITDMSPAISFAHSARRLVYSGYYDNSYTIYSMDSEKALEGSPVLADFGDRRLAVLPPRDTAGGSVLGLLRNPLFGLPEETSFPVSAYKPKMSLDYVASPQVAVGVDRYGSYAGGGITLLWSDMLGQHTVATMVQTSSRLKDTAALVGYQNSKNRMNWGVVAQRIPYVYGGYSAGYGNFLGEEAYIEEEDLYWQINYDLGGFISYPFSQVQRFELGGGYRYIDFQHEIITQAYSLYDNYLIGRDTQSLPAPKGIHWGYASAAMIYDSAIFGATAPIVGQSYILELSPWVGSISYNTILADYRRYLMPIRRITLAFRALHYGRYGKGANDDRLWPLFLGYETLVRGYDYNSFNSDEAYYGEGGRAFNSLFGSKIIVANAELRFPLFGVLGIGRGFYGVFPVDFIAFYDIGFAWDKAFKDEVPFLSRNGQAVGMTIFGPEQLERKRRIPVSSAGVGLRVNVLGYLVVGVNYVHPFNRPDKNWIFQFTITPGF